MTDEFFTIPTEEAKECLQAAQEMTQQFTEAMITTVHQQFSDWLVLGLRKLVDGASKSNGINREKLWSSFHQKTSSAEFSKKWKNFAAHLGVHVSPQFYQHATDEIFNKLIKDAFEVRPPAKLEEKVALSFEEENVVQYVGGYVLHSLMKDKKNSGIFPLLEKLCSYEESKYGETPVGTSRQWINSLNSLNRGGQYR